MELKRPKAILFDWDNTLVNTWPVIHEALTKTFLKMGHEPWSLELVKQRVARSMRDSFPLIFGENWQAAGELYQAEFRAIHLDRLEALPGAEATLVYLKDKPVYVALVSNKKGPNLRSEVIHIKWLPYFTKVVGANDTPHDKPHPDPVIEALNGSDIPAGGDVWFVGDSFIDMDCAHATGCVPIWYGEFPKEPLEHHYHTKVENHEELQALLKTVF